MTYMRATYSVLVGAGIIGLLGGTAAARDRPLLAIDAAAVLAQGALLLTDDNLLAPLSGQKAVSLLQKAPTRLSVLRNQPGEVLLVIDKDLYRLTGGTLLRIAQRIEAQPVCSDDGKVVLSLEDKRILVVTRGEAVDKIPYRRPGNWEFENPFISAEGKRALVTIRDYSAPLEVFEFVLVSLESRETEIVKLSQTFVPGPLRQPVADGLLMQMYANQGEEDGLLKLSETDFAVLNLATKKMASMKADTLPGEKSPSGKRSILPGPMVYSMDKRCGADRSLVFGVEPKPVQWSLGKDTVVSLYGFTPNEELVADLFNPQTCKHKGALIPLDKAVPQNKWRSIALPSHPGHLRGVVLLPAPTK